MLFNFIETALSKRLFSFHHCSRLYCIVAGWMTRGSEYPLSEVGSSMFGAGSAGGAGGGSAGGAGGYSECGDYGLGGYVPGGGRLQQYAAHFAPHQNVWHHHHAPHHDSYGKHHDSQYLEITIISYLPTPQSEV